MVSKDYMAKYYITNKDKIKTNHQKWVNKRREYIRDYMREYMKSYRQYKQVYSHKERKDHIKKKIEPIKNFTIKFSHKPVIIYF
jgi:hypothetical protein